MPTSTTIKNAIADGLQHEAVTDVDNIQVACDGPEVWLSGQVGSWAACRRARGRHAGHDGGPDRAQRHSRPRADAGLAVKAVPLGTTR